MAFRIAGRPTVRRSHIFDEVSGSHPGQARPGVQGLVFVVRSLEFLQSRFSANHGIGSAFNGLGPATFSQVCVWLVAKNSGPRLSGFWFWLNGAALFFRRGLSGSLEVSNFRLRFLTLVDVSGENRAWERIRFSAKGRSSLATLNYHFIWTIFRFLLISSNKKIKFRSNSSVMLI